MGAYDFRYRKQPAAPAESDPTAMVAAKQVPAPESDPTAMVPRKPLSERLDEFTGKKPIMPVGEILKEAFGFSDKSNKKYVPSVPVDKTSKTREEVLRDYARKPGKLIDLGQSEGGAARYKVDTELPTDFPSIYAQEVNDTYQGAKQAGEGFVQHYGGALGKIPERLALGALSTAAETFPGVGGLQPKVTPLTLRSSAANSLGTYNDFITSIPPMVYYGVKGLANAPAAIAGYKRGQENVKPALAIVDAAARAPIAAAGYLSAPKSLGEWGTQVLADPVRYAVEAVNVDPFLFPKLPGLGRAAQTLPELSGVYRTGKAAVEAAKGGKLLEAARRVRELPAALGGDVISVPMSAATAANRVLGEASPAWRRSFWSEEAQQSKGLEALDKLDPTQMVPMDAKSIRNRIMEQALGKPEAEARAAVGDIAKTVSPAEMNEAAKVLSRDAASKVAKAREELRTAREAANPLPENPPQTITEGLQKAQEAVPELAAQEIARKAHFDLNSLESNHTVDAKGNHFYDGIPERELVTIQENPAIAKQSIVDTQTGKLLWSQESRPGGALDEGQRLAFNNAVKEYNVKFGGRNQVRVQLTMDSPLYSGRAVEAANEMQSQKATMLGEIAQELNASPDQAREVFKQAAHLKLFPADRPLPTEATEFQGLSKATEPSDKWTKQRGEGWQEREAQGLYHTGPGTVMARHRAEIAELAATLGKIRANNSILDRGLEAAALPSVDVTPKMTAMAGELEAQAAIAGPAAAKALMEQAAELRKMAGMARGAARKAANTPMRAVDLNQIRPEFRASVVKRFGEAEPPAGKKIAGYTKTLIPAVIADTIESALRVPPKIGWTRWLGDGPTAKAFDWLHKAFVRTVLFTVPWQPVGLGNMAANFGSFLTASIKYGLPNYWKHYMDVLAEHLESKEGIGVGDSRRHSLRAEGKDYTVGQIRQELGGVESAGVPLLGEKDPTAMVAARLQSKKDAGVGRWGQLPEQLTLAGRKIVPEGVRNEYRGYIKGHENMYGIGFTSDMAAKEALLRAWMEKHPESQLSDAIKIAEDAGLSYSKQVPDFAQQMSATFFPFLNFSWAGTPRMFQMIREVPALWATLQAMSDAAQMQQAANEGEDLQEKTALLPSFLQHSAYTGDEDYLNINRFGTMRAMPIDVGMRMVGRPMGGGLGGFARSVGGAMGPLVTGAIKTGEAATGGTVIDPKNDMPVMDALDTIPEKLGKLALSVGLPYFVPWQAVRAYNELPTLWGKKVTTPYGGEVTKAGSILGLLGPTSDKRDPNVAQDKLENTYKSLMQKIEATATRRENKLDEEKAPLEEYDKLDERVDKAENELDSNFEASKETNRWYRRAAGTRRR